MATYRIVTFDGGGILGLLPAVLLGRLSAAVPGWLEKADMFAGTSTGGLLALGLAKGLTPKDLRALYEIKGPAIFDDSWLDNLIDLGQLRGAQFSNSNLTKELKRILGETTKLKNLSRKVVIPTFDLDNEDPNPQKRSWKPKFFHNCGGSDSDGDALVYKVGLYTAAAPTYFPSVDGYIDGGVVANNPSLAALAQTQDKRSFPKPPALEDILLISFSCGRSPIRIEGKNLDWGQAQWVQPLVQILLSGNTSVPDFQCRQFLRDNYHRVDPLYDPKQLFEIDNVAKIPALAAFAEGVNLSETVKWLKKNWV
jgi:hypothetical protein